MESERAPCCGKFEISTDPVSSKSLELVGHINPLSVVTVLLSKVLLSEAISQATFSQSVRHRSVANVSFFSCTLESPLLLHLTISGTSILTLISNMGRTGNRSDDWPMLGVSCDPGMSLCDVSMDASCRGSLLVRRHRHVSIMNCCSSTKELICVL